MEKSGPLIHIDDAMKELEKQISSQSDRLQMGVNYGLLYLLLLNPVLNSKSKILIWSMIEARRPRADARKRITGIYPISRFSRAPIRSKVGERGRVFGVQSSGKAKSTLGCTKPHHPGRQYLTLAGMNRFTYASLAAQ